MAPMSLPRSICDFRLGGVVTVGPMRNGDGPAENPGVRLVGKARNKHDVAIPRDPRPPSVWIGDSPVTPGGRLAPGEGDRGHAQKTPCRLPFRERAEGTIMLNL